MRLSAIRVRHVMSHDVLKRSGTAEVPAENVQLLLLHVFR